jgi:predicted tellurium resistance membrane protein TerC
MMQFAVPVEIFVNIHLFKSLTFILILIGMMLLTESAHLSNALIFDHVTPVPKGYLYFAISFSLLVEVLNMKMNKSKK